MPAGACPAALTETVRLLLTLPGANVTLAEPSALVAVPPLVAVTFAGGESPLAVLVTGFGGVEVVPMGAFVAPSDWFEGVVPPVAPPVLPPDVPLAPAVLAAVCVLDVSPGWPEAPADTEPLLRLPETAEPPLGPAAPEPIVPEPPVPAVTCCA